MLSCWLVWIGFVHIGDPNQTMIFPVRSLFGAESLKFIYKTAILRQQIQQKNRPEFMGPKQSYSTFVCIHGEEQSSASKC